MSVETEILDRRLFESVIGTGFEVGSEGPDERRATLTLKEVTALSRPHPARPEPFSLFFEGPASEPIGQGTYRFLHPGVGEHLIFIVPTAEEGSIRRYQAIFN